MAAQAKIAPINPKPFLESLVGKETIVKLKWGHEYRGILEAKDDYHNFKLGDCSEWGYAENDQNQRELICKGKIGDVLIRCNNVLYIREDDNAKREPEEEGEMAEE